MNATRVIVILSLFSLLVAAPRSAAATTINSEREITIRRTLCDICERVNDKRGAMEQYVALSRLAPEDAQIQYGFGLLLAKQNKHALAVVHFKEATQLNPDVTDYWVALANAYLQLRNYRGAADAFQQAGPKFDPNLHDPLRWGDLGPFPHQLKQYEDYNKKLKEQQEDQ